MADLIQIDNFINKYNDNLLSEDSLLKNSPTINFNSNTGSYSITNNDSYSNNSNCLEFTEVQNIVSGSFVQFDFGDALEYTALKDGSYIFQYAIFNKIVNASAVVNTEFKLKLYVNSVLIESYVTTIDINELEEEKYYNFAQSFNLYSGDVVNFAFEFFAPSVGAPNPNFTFNVGGFKLEVDDKFLGFPTIYSKPLEVASIPFNEYTGWGNYADNAYTVGSPLTIIDGASAVPLPNNKAITIETQKPTDITTFYDGTVITGRNGDGINITIDFKCKPTGAGANPKLTLYIDIGGAIGDVYVRDFVLSKGSGVEHYYLSSFNAYTLDTWESNGGTVMAFAENENIEIYDIRYVITRTHKAR